MESPKESLSEAIAAKEKKPASPIRNPFRKRRKTKDKDDNNQQRPRVILPSGNESDYSATDDESYLPKSLQFDPTMMESLGLSLSASTTKAKMDSGSGEGGANDGSANNPLAGVTPYDSDEDTLSEEPPPSKTKKETATSSSSSSSTASAENKSELGDSDYDGEYTVTDDDQNNTPSSTENIEPKVSLTPKLGNTNYDNTGGDGSEDNDDGNGVDSENDDIASLEVELIEGDKNDSVMDGYAADSNGNSNTGGDSTRKIGIGNSRNSPLLVGGTYKYKHQRKQKKSQLSIGDDSDEEIATKDANIIDSENNVGGGNDTGSGSDVGSIMPKNDADAMSSDNITEKAESGKESQAIAASQDLPPQSQTVDDSVDESIADSTAESIVTDGGGVDSSVEQEEISSRRQVHSVDDDDVSVSSVTALLAKAHQALAAAENDGNEGDVGVDVDGNGNGDTSFTSFATAVSTEQRVPVPTPVSSKPALSTISSMTSSMIPPPPPHSSSSAPSHPPLPPVPITRQRGSILRNSSFDRLSRSSSNDSNDSRGSDRNHRINRTNSDGSVRKAVSFADENGGTIHKQHTIAVSPNKLTRRVRRNKGSGLPPYYDSPAEDILGGNGISDGSGSGVLTMGRVLVLLMDPPTKQYELTSLPYPLVSNENGVVGPTQLGTLLDLVSKSASYEPLREKSYLGFCRPSLDDITAHFDIDSDGKEDGMTNTLVKEKEMMKNDLSVLDHKIVKDEVLVAVPDGYSAQDCLKFSLPILQDKRLVRLLKKLKKHERKAEKKRRMKMKSMKPNRSSSSYTSSDSSDGHMDAKESTLERTSNGGHTYDWKNIVAGGVVLLLLLSFVAGSYHTAFSNKIKSTRGRHRSSVIKKETCLGRGRICKPTFVRTPSRESPEKKNNWLKQLLSDLKLEEEILI